MSGLKKVAVHKNKRSDIQYLRCIAITAVLAFHLRPEYFPQGFLGVDIFFVISGYLMTKIMRFDTDSLSKWTVLQFYQRRLKRLLPAYLMVIALTLFICSFFLISTDFGFLKIDVIWASLFGTNMQSMFEKQTYFVWINEYKFLLHTWSLSVELQYYLIAPFLLYFIHKRVDAEVFWTIVVIALSLGFQGLSLGHESVSFGLLLSRIWQFMVGTLAYYLNLKKNARVPTADGNNLLLNCQDGDDDFVMLDKCKNRSNKAKTNCLQFIVTLLLLAVMFMPKMLDFVAYDVAVRVTATFLTGLSIYFEMQYHDGILNKIFMYYGDISYSVYLVHWPVIILLKYLNLDTQWTLLQILPIIFVLGTVQYESFEKRLLSAPGRMISLACFLLFVGIAVLETQKQGLGYLSKIPVHPSSAINQQIAKECVGNLPHVSANLDPELLLVAPKPRRQSAYLASFNGTGKAKIFLAGNSFAIRQFDAMTEALKGNYSRLYLVARPACLTFDAFNAKIIKGFQCDDVFNKTVPLLRKTRPDVMIINQRLSKNYFFDTLPNKTDARNATRIISDYLKEYSLYVKKIVLIEPHPTASLDNNVPERLAKMVSLNQPLDQFYLPLANVSRELDNAWKVIQDAAKTCDKCVIVPTRGQFCDESKCRLYEKKTLLSYYCDYSHLSNIGVKMLTPYYRKVLLKVLNSIGF